MSNAVEVLFLASRKKEYVNYKLCRILGLQIRKKMSDRTFNVVCTISRVRPMVGFLFGFGIWNRSNASRSMRTILNITLDLPMPGMNF